VTVLFRARLHAWAGEEWLQTVNQWIQL